MKNLNPEFPMRKLPVSKYPRRILCADDNTILGDILVRFFTQAGHTVNHAADGLEAWDRMSKDLAYFEVLVTNHEMPGLSGLELVDLLRQADYRGRIIVHSGALTVRQTADYRALKVDGIVAKATAAEELLRVVEAFADA